MNNLIGFNFEGADIRGGKDGEGEPLLVAKDVCEALGIKKHNDAIARLDDYCKGVPVMVVTPGGSQSMATVNEAGLYALIFKSRKKKAAEFRKWVFGTVLPAIRESGGYITPIKAQEMSDDPDVAVKFAQDFLNEHRAHKETQKRLTETLEEKKELSEELVEKDNELYMKNEQIKLLRVSDDYIHTHILPSECLLSSTELAASIGIGSAIALHKWLRDAGVLRWVNGRNVPTAEYARHGLVRDVSYSYKHRNGVPGIAHRIMWTEAGVVFVTTLYNLLEKKTQPDLFD